MLMLVITQTLKHGAREGLKVAMVPLLRDAPIIAASLWILARLGNARHIVALSHRFRWLKGAAGSAHRTRPDSSHPPPLRLVDAHVGSGTARPFAALFVREGVDLLSSA